ncbi:Frizzled-5 [Frankliniella fusca]|uniref:Frizzled-5 n=1 Tax=Frankliniella fusca TaxID=407009 RepID=A0AAE1HDE8_9NEOP|nr:Frizzled-5 [Frankliniella fusca]
MYSERYSAVLRYAESTRCWCDIRPRRSSKAGTSSGRPQGDPAGASTTSRRGDKGSASKYISLRWICEMNVTDYGNDSQYRCKFVVFFLGSLVQRVTCKILAF